jgi:chromosome segregation ATPase
MEGEAYPYAIREIDRRVSEAVTRINVLEAGKQENASRIAVLEAQREDMREDINRIGDAMRQGQVSLEEKIETCRRELKDDIGDLRGDLADERTTKTSSTLGQKIAYISAAGAVIASMLTAVALIFGHA